jgi:sugar transferase (PEP-CTERM/EpsH1 system associated)
MPKNYALAYDWAKKKKIKILFLVLEMDLGGLQRIVNLLIRMLDKNVFEPYIVCLDRGGIFYEQASSACADSLILERKPGYFDKSLFVRLLKILKEKRIDIIHSHNGCLSYSALAGRLSGVKVLIHTDHGRLVPDKKTTMLEDSLFSCMMDRFIGVSTELSEYLRSTVKIGHKKVMTIINGVDVGTFRPRSQEERGGLRKLLGLAESDRILGTVCRLDPIKNISFMISCMPDIIRRVPATKLVIVGDGQIKNNLIQQADNLGISSSVLFLGLRQDIENIVPAFDAYVCTSLSEGTSMTILEAMSCGLPVVASNVGGNVRLVNGSNGILFPLSNTESFIDGIVKILHNEMVRSEMGKRSRERVEKDFSIERMVKKYEQLYFSLL